MSELTPLSDMIAFKKSGHATSASLAKMLWEPGTNLKRDTPYETGKAVKEERALYDDETEFHNANAADKVEDGRFDSEEYTPGVNVPKNTGYASPNEDAQTAKDEAMTVVNDDNGLKGEFFGIKGEDGVLRDDPEGWMDFQYALAHPNEPESEQIISNLKRLYPNARVFRDV